MAFQQSLQASQTGQGDFPLQTEGLHIRNAPQADVSFDLREWLISGRKPAWLLSGTGQKFS
jgi:hypothetical protein